MPILKLKKAEPITVSPHLSIDSPMVIHFVDSLEGLTGEPTGEPTGVDTGGGPGPAPQVERYAAVCNEFHPEDTLLGIPAGRWLGPDRERYLEALDDATAHNNGGDTLGHPAYVALYVGSVLIGPVSQH